MKRALMTALVVLLSLTFLCLPASAQAGKLGNSSAQNQLIKNEVKTAVSMLQAIFTKHQQGEMNLEQTKKLVPIFCGNLGTVPKDISGPIRQKASMWFCTAERMWRERIGLRTRTIRAHCA